MMALGAVCLVDNWLPYALLSHHNRKVDLSQRPADEQIRITTAEGTMTEGWLIPAPVTPGESLPRDNNENEAGSPAALLAAAPRPTTLILLHGLGANRQDYLDFGLELQQISAQRGLPLTLAMMDLRSHGNSGGEYFTYGYHEAQDITALLDELDAQHGALESPQVMQYAILGVSVGGAVATATTARDDRVGALITIGTFADLAATAEAQTGILPDIWRDRVLSRAEAIAQFDIAQAAPAYNMAEVEVPVLIAHGQQDGYIPFENAEQLYAAANEPKQLYAIAEADHGDMISTGGAALQNEIVRFLEAAIAGP